MLPMSDVKLMRSILIPVAVLVLQGCATHYLYHGTIEAHDSAGQPRIVSVHWTVTERKLWFDNAHGSIELKTECSARTVHFRERADGIVFEREPSDEGVFGPVEIYGTCGEALGVKRIAMISPGELQIAVYCRELESERHLYLQPALEPYVFPVLRDRLTDPDDRAVRMPVCRDSAKS